MSAPIYWSVLPEWSDPKDVHAQLDGEHDNTVWLDAGPLATTGYSYVAGITDPLITEDVMDALRAEIPAPTAVDPDGDMFIPTGFPLTSVGPFRLGYVGWFGYEFGNGLVGIPDVTSPYPDACFARVRAMYAFDHAGQRVIAVAHTPQALAELVAAYPAGNVSRGRQETSGGGSCEAAANIHSSLRWRHESQHYENLVDQCRKFIQDGDAYLLCLTNQIRIPGDWDVLATYHALREDNPSHHGGLLRLGGVNLLSSSPEVFLRVTPDSRVTTMPIKGTRRRGATPDEDAQSIHELRSSEKERAENLMIVDLMRNDLSRVAVTGTVSADLLLEVETLPHVHQLVSTVSAIIEPGQTALDAFDACFPAGSMTGAPKRAAMQILQRLEQGPRGIYSGAFGWFGLDGCAELAMVIRSLVIDASGASIGSGGGVTSDSDPTSELDEMLLKAAAALRALGVL